MRWSNNKVSLQIKAQELDTYIAEFLQKFLKNNENPQTIP